MDILRSRVSTVCVIRLLLFFRMGSLPFCHAHQSCIRRSVQIYTRHLCASRIYSSSYSSEYHREAGTGCFPSVSPMSDTSVLCIQLSHNSSIRRCLFSPLSCPILFSDVIFADVFTSFAKVLGDVWLSICMLLPGGSLLALPPQDGWSRWILPTLMR